MVNNLLSETLSESQRRIMDDLFIKLSSVENDQETEQMLMEYTDYRNYLDYDIKIKYASGNFAYFSKVNKEKSGGETLFVCLRRQSHRGGLSGKGIPSPDRRGYRAGRDVLLQKGGERDAAGKPDLLFVSPPLSALPAQARTPERHRRHGHFRVLYAGKYHD